MTTKNKEMTEHAVALVGSARALRLRKSGEVASLSAMTECGPVRISTRAGDPAQFSIIGNDLVPLTKAAVEFLRAELGERLAKPEVDLELHSYVRDGGRFGKDFFVARITGSDPDYRFAKEFLPREKNLSRSEMSGKITVRITVPGLYQIGRQQLPQGEATVGKLRNCFLVVRKSGEIEEIPYAEFRSTGFSRFSPSERRELRIRS